MDAVQSKSSHNLFEVFLRLRPPPPGAPPSDRILTVEKPEAGEQDAGRRPGPSHVTLNPPSDRRRAIEKFAFTRIFEEDASQLDVFHFTDIAPLVEGVLAPDGGDGTDAVVATLGVTGSGKTHTILGSKRQRGLTQLSLDVLFRSIGANMLDSSSLAFAQDSLQFSDPCEAILTTAPAFLEGVYGEGSLQQTSKVDSRAATPLNVRDIAPTEPPPPTPRLPITPPSFTHDHPHHKVSPPRHPSSRPSELCRPIPCAFPELASPSPTRIPLVGGSQEVTHMRERSRRLVQKDVTGLASSPARAAAGRSSAPAPKRASGHKHFMACTGASRKKKSSAKQRVQGESVFSPAPAKRYLIQRPLALPPAPEVSAINVSRDPNAEYVVVMSMYEVHNDRIYDLLTPPSKTPANKELRRRPLLFKSTELSPDRKVVAGLRKVACSTLREAALVLEAGLHERRVAGTGSNSVSSRSHGFFCFEVKKRRQHGSRRGAWVGSKLTIVDLAGSERARDAKTQGATLVEAGKINESLMYLGQCLQTQSEAASSARPNIVPYRQCKLTELLFSNSFPSSSSSSTSSSSSSYSNSSASQQSHAPRRNPQKGVMIVTADPLGDFNATSQILRYSALAREVTVPRVPSITATILAHVPSTAGSVWPPSPNGGRHQQQAQPAQRPFLPPGPGPYRNRTPPMCADERATMELAALEIARLSDELSLLRRELDEQVDGRLTAEAHLLSMEDRMTELEAVIRDDCANEFEQRFALELARFKATMAMEKERNEEHWDRKVDLLERGLDTADGDKENILVENVEEEIERLRRENAILKRELACRSPNKRRPLEEREDFAASEPEPSVASLGRSLSSMRVSGGVGDDGSPQKTRRQTKRTEADRLQS